MSEPTGPSPDDTIGDPAAEPPDHPEVGPADEGDGGIDPFALRSRGRPLPSRAGGWGAAPAPPGGAPGSSRRPGPGQGVRRRLRRAATPARRGPGGAGDGLAGGPGTDSASARGHRAAPPASGAAVRRRGAGRAGGSTRGVGRRDRGGRAASLGGAVPGGVALRAAGRGVRATVRAGPLALFLLLALVVFVVVPTTGALSGGAPQVAPGAAATAEIPRGYLEAYMAA
ncbi:MAG TPA: hypothetical protein VFZ77_14145, partial [Acidimicrobiales bacterium]